MAAGSFVRSCPEESREYLATLRPIFMQNLRDPISTIRQGAAQALADCVRAYGAEFLDPLATEIRAGLTALSQPQPGGHQETKARDVVVEDPRPEGGEEKDGQSENQFMLVDPRLQQCVDCCSALSQIRRLPEPWEAADGCLHLVTELSTVQGCEGRLADLLPLVAESGRQRHYGRHLNYCSSLCTCLGRMAATLPKRLLKASLEDFFDTIFYALESSNSLASYSAEACLHKIAMVIGPNILRGRIENYNPRYLALYTRLRPGGHQLETPARAVAASSAPTGEADLRSSLSLLLSSTGERTPARTAVPSAGSRPISVPGSGRGSSAPSLGGTPT